MTRRRGPHRFKADTEVWVSPPAGARSAARWMLRVRESIPASRRGGTAAGVARARSIAAGELQPAREVSGWFARHAGYIEKAERRKLGVMDSRALQSALLWGSWPMLEAAERALDREA